MDPISESKSSVPNNQIDAWLAAVDKLHKAVAELQAAKEKAKKKLRTKISVPSKKKEEKPPEKNKNNKNKEKPETDDSEVEKPSKGSKPKKKSAEKIEKVEKKPTTRGRKPKANKEEEAEDLPENKKQIKKWIKGESLTANEERAIDGGDYHPPDRKRKSPSSSSSSSSSSVGQQKQKKRKKDETELGIWKNSHLKATEEAGLGEDLGLKALNDEGITNMCFFIPFINLTIFSFKESRSKGTFFKINE